MPQQMPVGMAEGGLVAFEGGGPIRAQEGFLADLRRYVLPHQNEERKAAIDESLQGIGQNILGATSGIPLPSLTPYGADPGRSPLGNFLRSRLSQSEDPAYVLPPGYTPLSKEPIISLQRLGLGGKKSETDTMLEMVAKQQAERERQDNAKKGAATPTKAPAAAPGGAPGGLGAFKPGPLPSNQPVIDAIKALREQTKMPTERDIEAAGQARARRYEEELPFREKEILEERITNRAEQIAKDKDMSFNDALIAAGAAILKSPGTPGSIAWMGEGLSAFGSTMKEGRKDLRKSQELMEQAQLELARAESARDAGKFNQYEAGREKFLDLANKSREFAATNAALAVNQYTAQVAAYKLPFETEEMQSKAALQRATASLYEKGGTGALTAAAKANQPMTTVEVEMAKARILADPRYKNASPEMVDQILKQMYGDRYVSLPSLPPLIRGADTGGATLPGT
jgi:hypothetical protein